MGYLTTFTVYNDSCDQIKKHPDKFADIISDGCSGRYNYDERTAQVGLGNHANLITIQRPRHADADTLFIHYGNYVFDIDDLIYPERSARPVSDETLSVVIRLMKDRLNCLLEVKKARKAEEEK